MARVILSVPVKKMSPEVSKIKKETGQMLFDYIVQKNNKGLTDG